MEERVTAEIALLKSAFPELEIGADLWCRFPAYKLPPEIWNAETAELAFQIPAQLPAAAPYGFWVRPQIALMNGAAISSYTPNVTIPLGEGWGQFSWVLDPWTPATDITEITKGTNMVNFVESFAARLREPS
jgi:hypothetical protein